MPFLVDTKMCCLHFINTLPVKHFNKIHCITSISLWQYHGKGNKYCLHIVLWNHIDDTYLSYQHFTQWKWWIKNTFCYRICLNFVNGKREFSIQWVAQQKENSIKKLKVLFPPKKRFKLFLSHRSHDTVWTIKSFVWVDHVICGTLESLTLFSGGNETLSFFIEFSFCHATQIKLKLFFRSFSKK